MDIVTTITRHGNTFRVVGAVNGSHARSVVEQTMHVATRALSNIKSFLTRQGVDWKKILPLP